MNDSQPHSHKFYRNFSSSHSVDAKPLTRKRLHAVRLAGSDLLQLGTALAPTSKHFAQRDGELRNPWAAQW